MLRLRMELDLWLGGVRVMRQTLLKHEIVITALLRRSDNRGIRARIIVSHALTVLMHQLDRLNWLLFA